MYQVLGTSLYCFPPKAYLASCPSYLLLLSTTPGLLSLSPTVSPHVQSDYSSAHGAICNLGYFAMFPVFDTSVISKISSNRKCLSTPGSLVILPILSWCQLYPAFLQGTISALIH